LATASSLDARTERGEQSVGLDNDADQEQAGDQYKRRPGSAGSLTDRSAHQHDRTQRRAWGKALFDSRACGRGRRCPFDVHPRQPFKPSR
jgi:hypothetical protein